MPSRAAPAKPKSCAHAPTPAPQHTARRRPQPFCAAHRLPALAAVEKKLWKGLKPRCEPGSGAAVHKKASSRKQKALFNVVRAAHQKGPHAGSFTNHVIAFLRGSNMDNDKLRAALAPFMLGERLKWNQEQLAFALRLYSKKQAAKVLAAMRAYLPASDAADLPEAVDDAPWCDDTNAAIDIVPCKRILEPFVSQFDDGAASSAGATTEDVVLLDGSTYPHKEPLKDMGFKWVVDFNGIPGAVRAPPSPPPTAASACARPRPGPRLRAAAPHGPAHAALGSCARPRCRPSAAPPPLAEPLGAPGRRLRHPDRRRPLRHVGVGRHRLDGVEEA